MFVFTMTPEGSLVANDRVQVKAVAADGKDVRPAIEAAKEASVVREEL